MAVYRQIHVSFWQDPFVSELTPEQKYFYLYLMTNSKTKQCGVYEISKKTMVFETGYNLDTVEKLLCCFVNHGKIEYNDATNEVLLKNWLKYNISKSPKVLSCILSEIKSIKHRPFAEFTRSACIEYGYSMDTVPIQYGYSMDTVPIDYTKTMGKNNNNKNKKNNNKDDADEGAYRSIQHLVLTQGEYAKLCAEFGDSAVGDVLDSMENYAKLKNYKSAYLTAANWLRKRRAAEGVKPVVPEVGAIYKRPPETNDAAMLEVRRGLDASRPALDYASNHPLAVSMRRRYEAGGFEHLSLEDPFLAEIKAACDKLKGGQQ